MISKKFLPKFFKDVLTHIPTIALKSIDWKAVLKEMGPMVFKIGTLPLEQKKIETLSLLKIDNLSISEHIEKNSKKSNTDSDNKLLGHTLLKIYFAQFKNQSGLILDLRKSHFQNEDNRIVWSPNNSWYKLDEEFRESIIKIYKGFYYEDNDLFESGLSSIGMTKGLDSQKVDELKALFFAHFGPGDQKLVRFELETFSESFYKLFNFFVTNKVKLHKDFIFIGIYLVTLYMHLEKLDQELNVRECFLEIYPKD